ncbi:hypothetical protein [Silvanigrella sp.]|jgi:hypothetical protein|uniref:hypothetical protein n=1 Tax=Silvanigrella sp. TaxID=2024976 RepID=UPI0037C7A41C
MYFLNIKKLKNQIISNQLSEKDKLFYYLGTFIVYLLGYEIIQLESIHRNRYEWFSYAIYFLSAILSIILCYKLNASNKENDFLGKYISISFVLNNLLFVLFIIPFIILTVFIQNELIVGVIFEIFLSISSLILMYRVFKDIQIKKSLIRNT